MTQHEAQPSREAPLVKIDGAFTIEALTSKKEGFKALGRGATRAAFLEGIPRVGFDSPEQAAQYKQALLKELQFNNGSIGQKIGIRNPNVEGDTISFDAIKVPYPAYAMFASPEASPELSSLVEASGVAMPVTTSDGRLILQHRAVKKHRMLGVGQTRGNGLYADIPGASVAGMFDASFTPEADSEHADKSKPLDMDEDSIQRAILNEAGEELGLGPEHLRDVRVIGLARDLQKPHDEFLLRGKTDLTAAEVYEVSRQSGRNKDLGDADFEERFIDIAATPEAIETLLTRVKSPLPPSHAAAMLAAGYLTILEQTSKRDGESEEDYRARSLEDATVWRDRIADKITENYVDINEKIARYYEKFPETVNHVPERYWGKAAPSRNLSGYSAAYTPEEQGLPSFEDEMVRTGLTLENRQVVPHIHLFDIDGVLSDPHEKQVIYPELLDSLIIRLEAGEPVALNTGRSVEWAIEKIVTPLLEKVEDKSLLKYLSVIGEKGNTWVTIDDSGNLLYGKAEVGVDKQLLDRLNTLVEEKYSDVMGNLEPKHTMISYEMHKGVDLATFQARQPEFVADVREVLKELGKDTELSVDATTIAVDIESPHAGKALGAKRFIDILKERDINFNEAHFSTYGDNTSDADMAEELARRGLVGDFVYVGTGTMAPNPTYYTLHDMGDFTAGTLNYLQQQEREAKR